MNDQKVARINWMIKFGENIEKWIGIIRSDKQEDDMLNQTIKQVLTKS